MQRSTNTMATRVKIVLFVSVCLALLGGGVLVIGQSSTAYRKWFVG